MKKRYTINHKRISRFLIALFIIIPIGIMSYTLLYEELQKERDIEITKNLQIADLTAHYLDDYINSFRTALENFAANPSVTNEDTKMIKQIMKDMELAQPEPSLFWMANSSGNLVAKYPDAYMDQNIFDRDFFKETMKGNSFIDGPYIGRVTGLEIVVVTAPYFRDGEVVGVVGVSIPLSELQKRLATIEIGESGYASLITMNGEVLSHPNLREFRETYSFPQSPLFDALYRDQVSGYYFDKVPNEPGNRLHAFVKLKEIPWVVVIVQPLNDFNLRLSQTLGRNFVFVVLMGLLIGLLIHYILLLRDMKNAEKIRQTEKLAIVGELAAGVAHEIRNPLTSIKGFVQLIDSKKESKIPSLYITTILDELNRIEQIVGEMVVLAKPAPEEKNKVDIANVLNDTVNLMAPQASLKNVKIVLEVQADLPVIQAVQNQLKQVFINLIKNSIEALEDGGKIRIKAIYKSEKILITIVDNGKGIQPEVLKKLGTPFFTTKQDGTGLGLMISYRIIQNHKGEISVESQPNIGTKFQIELPIRS